MVNQNLISELDLEGTSLDAELASMFSEEQNETFKGLVSGMRRSGVVVGLASLILLAYQLVDHFGVSLGNEPPEAVGYLDLTIWCLLAVVGVVVAVLLVRATSGFAAVIETEGDDIEHLMYGPNRPATVPRPRRRRQR